MERYKGMVDPKTAKKFVVLGSNYRETLLKYIDEDSLPVEYGALVQNHYHLLILMQYQMKN